MDDFPLRLLVREIIVNIVRPLLLVAITVVLAYPAVGKADAVSKVPPPGEWDGVTAKAKLDRPYEDQVQAHIPFGITSFFVHPWRAYMDTQPASQFLGSMGVNMNNDPADMDAVMQLLDEAGIRKVRYECGWGNLDWNDQLSGTSRAQVIAFLQLARKHHLRPLMLLNGHHAVPCPVRDIPVEFVADAHKGDRTLKVRPEDVAKIHVGYTGPWDVGNYCSADPLITQIAADGTCTLSKSLAQDMKTGPQTLRELKYLPLHGVGLKGADGATNQAEAAALQATLDGWKKYVEAICDVAVEGLGTKGQPDAGFDLEVWNEQTFGANFLDINNYFDPKKEYLAPVTYTLTRPVGPGMRPDAKTDFREEGPMVLVGRTVDIVHAHPEFAAVKIADGIGNQWPWNSGADAWPTQDAYSRHYYTGPRDISPATIYRPNAATLNALDKMDGQRPNPPKDWCDIIPGTNFIPTMRIALPEFTHCGFQTESLARDVLPDVRWGGDSGYTHGRFTHNGDFHLMELWQTEVNFSRQQFFDELFKKSKISQDDPKAFALDSYMAGKMILRQYLFHNQKGLRNFYIFATAGGAYNFGFFDPPFFKALTAAKGQLNDDVRKEIPAFMQGLGWITKQMESGEPLAATRALKVDELWEYKPRLMYAGDGSPAHPHQWNRDWFAFLPYQLSANKFLIPYYVMTVDTTRSLQPDKDALDPMRYQMADQDFDVTIGNIAGTGAHVSVYDPMINSEIPVSIVAEKSDATHLTVKLKTTDYPRCLLVEEASPGALIQAPISTSDDKGNLHLDWKTNIPVTNVKVSYGRDWPSRDANQKQIAPARDGHYSVNLATGSKGMIAARISVEANGLTCVWPRWDEDPQGQVVVPGATKADVATLDFNSVLPDGTQAQATATPLTGDPTISLPSLQNNPVHSYKIGLPTGFSLDGSPDEMETTVGTRQHPVLFRARYLVGANHSSIDSSLPFTATGDELQKSPVKLPSGAVATLVRIQFMPALHPDIQNFAQKLLFVPSGRDNADFTVLAAEGTPDNMKAQDALITSIFASYQPPVAVQ